MITAILTAAVAVSQFSLIASPASYDAAQAHHTYPVSVANSGTRMEVVFSGFYRAEERNGRCVLDDTNQAALGWAHYEGKPVFRLAPGQTYRTHIRLDKPPPGRFELIAAFETRSQHGQVAVHVGAGTTFRTSQPGRTRVPPCPQATVVAPRHGLPVFTFLIAGLLAGFACLAAWGARLRRRRNSGRAS